MWKKGGTKVWKTVKVSLLHAKARNAKQVETKKNLKP